MRIIKQVAILAVGLFFFGCVDLIATQSTVSEQKKEEAERAEQQTKRIEQDLKKAQQQLYEQADKTQQSIDDSTSE